MPFDFPPYPDVGAQVSGPNGALYQWDGTKWVFTGTLPDAPDVAHVYGRQTASWIPVLPLTGGALTGPLTVTGGASSGGVLATLTLDGGASGNNPGLILKRNVGNQWWFDNYGGTFYWSYADASGNWQGDILASTTVGIQMQGGKTLTLAADPTNSLHAATKNYVDNRTPITADAPADSFAYGRLNNAWRQVLPLSGGTLTGALTLAADPTTNLQATTKQYVDTALAAPLDARFINVTGDTMTGPLTLPGNPGLLNEAANKGYVDGRTPITTDAPTDGKAYLRASNAWTSGGTLGGMLTLSGPPVGSLDAASKDYVDTTVASHTRTTLEYTFATNTNPPPNSGQVRFNNNTQSAVTTIWMHDTTQTGVDATYVLGKAQLGDALYIQDKDDATKVQEYTIVATPSDNGTYFTFSVTWLKGQNNITAAGRIVVSILGGARLGEAPTDGAVYGRQGSNASWQSVLPIAGGTLTGLLTLIAPGTALDLERGDVNDGSGGLVQAQFGFNGSGQYRHYLVTRHNATGGNTNAFDFFVNEGNASGTLATSIWSGSFTPHGISIPPGTAANPTLNFGAHTGGGDTGTGLYSHGPGGISLALSGTQAAKLDTNGFALTNSGFIATTTGSAFYGLMLNGPVSWRALGFQTNGVQRWTVGVNNTAESGGSAGSDFYFQGWNDAASANTIALTISRATGLTTVAGDPTAPLGIATKQYADTKLALSGGTMTGPLTLAADPTTNLQASTKRYVDNAVASASTYHGTYTVRTNTPDLSNTAGNLNGYYWVSVTADPNVAEATIVALPGIPLGTMVNNGDEIVWNGTLAHYDKVGAGGMTQAQADARYVNLDGDVMTGALTLSADPTGNLQAATKQYVDGKAGITDAPADGYLHMRMNNAWASGGTVQNATNVTAQLGANTLAVIGNMGGTFSGAGSNGVIGWNYNAGQAEIDFINTFTGFAGGFAWFTANTGTPVQTMALSAGGDLSLTHYGVAYQGLTGGSANLIGFRWGGDNHIHGYVDGTDQGGLALTTDLGAYLPTAGGSMTGGISWGGAVASGPQDTTKTLTLWDSGAGSTYGFCVTSSTLNYNTVGAPSYHDFYNGAVLTARITQAGITAYSALTVNGTLHATGAVGGWGAHNIGQQLLISTNGANPALGIGDSTASNWWALANMAGTLRFASMPALTDTTTAPLYALEIDHTTGLVTLNDGLHVASPGTMTVDYTLKVSGPSADFILEYPSAAADTKQWDFLPGNGNLAFRAVNDAFTAASPWLVVDRSGTSITDINLYAPKVYLSGGISFGQRFGGSPADTTQHISLYDGWGGFSITSGSLNIVAGGSAAFTMTGTDTYCYQPLTLPGEPTANNQAATKGYSDRNKTRGLLDVSSNAASPTVAACDYAYLYVYGSPTGPVTVTMPTATTVRLLWTVNNATQQPVTFQGAGGGTVTIPVGGSQGIWTDTGGIYPLYKSNPQFFGTQPGGGSNAAFIAEATNYPCYTWFASAQATDTKYWDAIVSVNQLLFRAISDDNSAAGNWLVATRTGTSVTSIALQGATAVTGTVTATDHILSGTAAGNGSVGLYGGPANAGAAPGYVAFFDGNNARVGYIGFQSSAGVLAMQTENGYTGWAMNGGLTVGALQSNGSISINTGSQTSPSFQIYTKGNGTDSNTWDWFVSGNTLAFRLINDAYSAGTNWLSVSRSGMTVTGISVGGPITLPADPTTAMQAVTKQYSDTKAPLANPIFSAGVFEHRVAMAALNIDLNTGSVFTKTISGASTLTLSNVPATGTVASFILELTNGGANVTFWANVRWPGGTKPTLSTTGLDVLGFYTTDAGANWRGLLLGKAMA